jgi:hypothetical protein
MNLNSGKHQKYIEVWNLLGSFFMGRAKDVTPAIFPVGSHFNANNVLTLATLEKKLKSDVVAS